MKAPFALEHGVFIVLSAALGLLIIFACGCSDKKREHHDERERIAILLAGPDWEQRFPANKPSGRRNHKMAYDSVRNVTVLFGGMDVSSYFDETWEYDGNTWTQKFPIDKPTPRILHAMAYDSSRNVTVLFGGMLEGVNASGETWLWNGTNWTLVNTVHSPSARSEHAMAFDAARNVVVLYGGQNGSLIDETWVFDGTDWTQKFPSACVGGKIWHSMAFDSARNVVVLFGGGADDNTWEWNGANWILRFPLNKPMPCYDHAMVYDSFRNVTVLLGGLLCNGDGLSDTTWEWDGSNWTEMSPITRPPGREWHDMVFDSSRNVVVLFGGYTLEHDNETWEYGY
ncbi:MAG: Kelch repeat-containing protein [Planctomycetota bacterium]|jgi:hypothetical protein